MRTLSSEIQDVIAGRLTSFAVCWRIRKNDGTFLYGTEHDRDIEIEDGDLAGVYESQFNISGSDIKSSSDLSVDNLEVAGATDQIFAAAMRVVDIESGILDQAQVIIFLVDWSDPGKGQVIVRAGYIGQINRDSSTRYRAEVRGLLQKLSQQIGQNYSEMCNVVRFGDERCKFDVSSITQACVVDEVISRKVFYAVIIDPDAATVPTMLPRGGEVTWASGGNTGFTREVKTMSFTAVTFTFKIELYEEAAADILPGDFLDVVPGCDRQASTCRFVYNNLDNFRGYGLYVPGILAIMRGNSVAGCVIPLLGMPGVDPNEGGGGGGDPPDPPPVTPPDDDDDPLPEEPPTLPPVVPPVEDGRNIFWNGVMSSGRVGPGPLLGLGFMGCKFEPEGGVDTWASPQSAPIQAGSVAVNLDQRVVTTDSFDGETISAPMPGRYFMRQRLYYSKQYECVNNRQDPDLDFDKPRCYWTPTQSTTGHDFDREVWFGVRRYLHPHHAVPDYNAPRDHAGGPTLLSLEASDNFSQVILGMFKPPLSAASNYDGSLGGDQMHYMLWYALNPDSPTQPGREFGAPKGFYVSLGSIEDDCGLWTDWVWRYRMNPFTVSTNGSTKGGRNHIYAGNKGILQIWKSTGPYLDADNNRAMTKVFDLFNEPVGCVPHATLRLCGIRLGIYHYGWKHNTTSKIEPRYYATALGRWGFRKPPEAGEIFTQYGTKDIDVNPSGDPLTGWTEQDGYVEPPPPSEPPEQTVAGTFGRGYDLTSLAAWRSSEDVVKGWDYSSPPGTVPAPYSWMFQFTNDLDNWPVGFPGNKAFKINLDWRQVEGTENVYDFSELDKLSTLPAGWKYVQVDFRSTVFDNHGGNADETAPLWLAGRGITEHHSSKHNFDYYEISDSAFTTPYRQVIEELADYEPPSYLGDTFKVPAHPRLIAQIIHCQSTSLGEEAGGVENKTTWSGTLVKWTTEYGVNAYKLGYVGEGRPQSITNLAYSSGMGSRGGILENFLRSVYTPRWENDEATPDLTDIGQRIEQYRNSPALGGGSVANNFYLTVDESFTPIAGNRHFADQIEEFKTSIIGDPDKSWGPYPEKWGMWVRLAAFRLVQMRRNGTAIEPKQDDKDDTGAGAVNGHGGFTNDKLLNWLAVNLGKRVDGVGETGTEATEAMCALIRTYARGYNGTKMENITIHNFERWLEQREAYGGTVPVLETSYGGNPAANDVIEDAGLNKVNLGRTMASASTGMGFKLDDDFLSGAAGVWVKVTLVDNNRDEWTCNYRNGAGVVQTNKKCRNTGDGIVKTVTFKLDNFSAFAGATFDLWLTGSATTPFMWVRVIKQ